MNSDLFAEYNKFYSTTIVDDLIEYRKLKAILLYAFV